MDGGHAAWPMLGLAPIASGSSGLATAWASTRLQSISPEIRTQPLEIVGNIPKRVHAGQHIGVQRR